MVEARCSSAPPPFAAEAVDGSRKLNVTKSEFSGTAPKGAMRPYTESNDIDARIEGLAYAAALFTQPLHQPADATLLPGKIVQGPTASPALPWNCEQFPQLSGLADLVTYPNAFAVGSFESSAGESP